MKPLCNRITENEGQTALKCNFSSIHLTSDSPPALCSLTAHVCKWPAVNLLLSTDLIPLTAVIVCWMSNTSTCGNKLCHTVRNGSFSCRSLTKHKIWNRVFTAQAGSDVSCRSSSVKCCNFYSSVLTRNQQICIRRLRAAESNKEKHNPTARIHVLQTTNKFKAKILFYWLTCSFTL